MSEPATESVSVNIIRAGRYFHSLPPRRCATCGERIEIGQGAVADYDRREVHHIGCAVPDVRRGRR